MLPWVTYIDDGSVAYEWIYGKKLRFMLAVENDGSVIWSVVGADFEIQDSGYMPEDFVKEIIFRNPAWKR